MAGAVRGYHGTSEAAVLRMLEGDYILSDNDYDWLGTGLYFFEEAPDRAWRWAVSRYGERAALMSCVIDLQDCIDLEEAGWQTAVKESYELLLMKAKQTGAQLPVNKGGAHRLDCVVINAMVERITEQGQQVRALRQRFPEGRLFAQSELQHGWHVQIAVRDTSILQDCRREYRGDIAYVGS